LGPAISTRSSSGPNVERLIWAGNSIDKAREIFDDEVSRGPRLRMTIRQRTRVLQRWPAA